MVTAFPKKEQYLKLLHMCGTTLYSVDYFLSAVEFATDLSPTLS
jgi:hypothetical protein